MLPALHKYIASSGRLHFKIVGVISVFVSLLKPIKHCFEFGCMIMADNFESDSDAVYKEKYRNLKRKLKFLIYVSSNTEVCMRSLIQV